MIRLFNTNHPSVYISLLVLSLATRISLILDQGHTQQSIDILDFSLPTSPLFAWILSSVTGLLCGVLFNSVLISHDTVNRRTHLPAFGFIVFSSLAISPSESPINSIGLLLCLLAIINFGRLTLEGNPVSSLFFGGFFIALASMVFAELSFLLLLSIYIFRDARIGTFRAFFLTAIGFATAIYFVWTGYFLFDKGFVFFDHYLAGFEWSRPQLQLKATSAIRNISLVVFGLLGLLSTLNSDAWRNVQPRKWLSFFLLIAVVFGFVSLFVAHDFAPVSMVSLALSALMTHFFLAEKRTLLRQAILLLLLGLSIAGQLISSEILVLSS